MAFSKEGAKATAMTAGVGAVVGLIAGQWVGREKFGDVAAEEVVKYAAGQDFDHERFVLDSLTRPVDKAAVEAVIRGGLRKYGEEDVTQPSPKARAVVLCAGAAANTLALGDEVKNNIVAAGQFEENNDDDAAEQAFTVAADGCQVALDGALGGEGDLVFPVDDK